MSQINLHFHSRTKDIKFLSFYFSITIKPPRPLKSSVTTEHIIYSKWNKIRKFVLLQVMNENRVENELKEEMIHTMMMMTLLKNLL
jgi:hypothetical protein